MVTKSMVIKGTVTKGQTCSGLMINWAGASTLGVLSTGACGAASAWCFLPLTCGRVGDACIRFFLSAEEPLTEARIKINY